MELKSTKNQPLLILSMKATQKRHWVYQVEILIHIDNYNHHYPRDNKTLKLYHSIHTVFLTYFLTLPAALLKISHELWLAANRMPELCC
jgi:hypothetical protein